MSPLRLHLHSTPVLVGVLPNGHRVLLRALCLGIFLLTGGALITTQLSAAEPGFVVVMRQDEPETALDREFVTDAFLKKRTRWPGGEVIHPVDQRRDATVRRVFSREVLKRSVEAVRSYWQQRIFSGRDVPPPEVDSDTEVIRFIRQNPGSIGYVTEAVDVQGVRVVTLR